MVVAEELELVEMGQVGMEASGEVVVAVLALPQHIPSEGLAAKASSSLPMAYLMPRFLLFNQSSLS